MSLMCVAIIRRQVRDKMLHRTQSINNHTLYSMTEYIGRREYHTHVYVTGKKVHSCNVESSTTILDSWMQLTATDPELPEFAKVLSQQLCNHVRQYGCDHNTIMLLCKQCSFYALLIPL